MIRKNFVKEKIKNGEPVLMGCVCINDSATAEIMALCGIDIIIIDNEHIAFDDNQIFNIARAVTSHGSACLLRTAIKDVEKLSRYMELGISGLCATQTHSIEEARNVIKAVKYPPIGNRGLCTYSSGFNYGFIDDMSIEDYMNFANDNTIIFITLEDTRGIDEVEKIAKLKEIDSIHIGPNDLSASMGFGGDTKRQEVIDVIMNAQNKIINVGNTTGKFVSSPEAIPEMIANGEKILMIGSDIAHLRNALMRYGKALKKIT